MSYIYDTQVIYDSTKSDKNNFWLDGCGYYKTETGISKKQLENGRKVKITEDEYNSAWNRYAEIFC